MREVVIETKGKTYSTIHFAGTLVQAAKKFNSDVLVQIVSENGVSGQVDLKSYLGTIAVMANCSKEIHLLIIGEDEDAAAFELNRVINKALAEY